MGLDMYLEREVFVGAKYNHLAEKLKNFKIEYPEAGIQRCRVSSIVEEVGYWRKANHIHKWFVDNVQDGKDECQRSYVGKEELKALHDLCVEVLDSKDTSKLPPCEGFFFGGTEIDEYYWEDLQDTIDIIKPILELENDPASYYYRSSW